MAGAQGGEDADAFPRFGRTLDTGDYRTVPNVTEQDLDTLDEREREVVRLAFGLPDGEPASYPEIGRKLGVSGERVRQIRNAALGKLQRIVNPDWPWPKGQAPQGWRLKDALDTAGFCWPSGDDWPPDQLPTGFDPAGHPAAPDVGLAVEEIVPGITSLRMDPLLLLRDPRVVNPPDRERMRIGIFVCVSSAEDRDETTWVAITRKARPDRLPIESRWRQGGNHLWRSHKLYLMDAGKWIGPRAAFASASWRESFIQLSERASLTAEGLAAVRASVFRGSEGSAPDPGGTGPSSAPDKSLSERREGPTETKEAGEPQDTGDEQGKQPSGSWKAGRKQHQTRLGIATQRMHLPAIKGSQRHEKQHNSRTPHALSPPPAKRMI